MPASNLPATRAASSRINERTRLSPIFEPRGRLAQIADLPTHASQGLPASSTSPTTRNLMETSKCVARTVGGAVGGIAAGALAGQGLAACGAWELEPQA
jgi:hypothetical protein